MQAGFYTIMAAQFFSSLADNALLVAAIQMLRDLESPAWMTPSLKQCFVISYVVLAPVVGAFADSMPKGRVMLITNAVKIIGCGLMLFSVHPLAAYAIVGLGAAAAQAKTITRRFPETPQNKVVVASEIWPSLSFQRRALQFEKSRISAPAPCESGCSGASVRGMRRLKRAATT